MKTVEGNKLICAAEGKICYSEREAGLVINGLRKHFHLSGRHWAKTSHGHSKYIPRRKYYCKNCGCYHVTHKALFTGDSRSYAWEDAFYRDYGRREERGNIVK